MATMTAFIKADGSLLDKAATADTDATIAPEYKKKITKVKRRNSITKIEKVAAQKDKKL